MKEIIYKILTLKHFKKTYPEYLNEKQKLLFCLSKEFYLKLQHKNNIYYLKIIKNVDENKYYLHLAPYNHSSFLTEINYKELSFRINMILWAIKENEELYQCQN